MCGIFGYIGPKNAVDMVIGGLKKLEYRGYDSAGLAGISDGRIVFCKEVGKVSALEEEVKPKHFDLHVAIAQTRWATHGRPTVANAHPHFNGDHTLALVHNGIVENHEQLREMLKKQGVTFVSDTDTEVVAHLISSYYHGDILDAIRSAIALLRGSYALTIIHKDYPDQIFAVTHESPLVIGMGKGESFISSDSNSFAAYTRTVVYLANGEIAIVKKDHFEVYNAELEQVDKEARKLSEDVMSAEKGDYEHYTLKEIFEQSETIKYAMLSRVDEEYGTAFFEDLHIDLRTLQAVERILILGCGTSWNAGYVAAYMLEERARIPVQVEISSEFRYKNPIIRPNTLVIAISQSGETADTIAAVRELKAKGARIIALCNVPESTLSREADSVLFLRAGPEIGVCSTKAFTSQLVVLSLFTLLMARMKHMDKAEGIKFINALRALPEQVLQVLALSTRIEEISKKYAKYDNFFFLGRGAMYPTAMEGALKLKEISYINANGYPAGEMKHGPIALINENCPTVALCANENTFDKILSNLNEVKARNGKIIAVVMKGSEGIDALADDVIIIPHTTDDLAPILATVVTQLFAYYVALDRGADIDQPRNLAKSVTVE
jgi:glucosamine--fructose-6-phosphate aminotransferase (isomerizing)